MRHSAPMPSEPMLSLFLNRAHCSHKSRGDFSLTSTHKSKLDYKLTTPRSCANSRAIPRPHITDQNARTYALFCPEDAILCKRLSKQNGFPPLASALSEHSDKHRLEHSEAANIKINPTYSSLILVWLKITYTHQVSHGC